MATAARQKAVRRLAILVLEDEPFIALDLQLAFEDEGAEAHIATTCDDAIAIMARVDLDAAVLDVNLGGGQTCEQAAAALRQQNIPFILHTGDLDRQGEMLRSLEAKVIPKPTPAIHVARSLLEMLEQDA